MFAGNECSCGVDFNVPIEDGQITDDRRIVQALPTIQDIINRGGRLVLMSHLGRPKGGPEPKFSLKPVSERLSKLLGKPVGWADDSIGPLIEQQSAALRDGDVLLLENLRFHKQEEKNDPNFARNWRRLGDVYVNDAFGTAHREHASTFGVAQALAGKPRVIGQLIRKELKFLGDAISKPARPFVGILGGAKVSDKIKVIEQLLGKCDTLLIGGAMAYTFFLAQGKSVGKSLVERDKVDLAKSLLAKSSGKIKLPVDTVISDRMTDDAQTQIVEGDIPTDMEGFDIGPEDPPALQRGDRQGQNDPVERPDGSFREKAVRGRHPGDRRGRRRRHGEQRRRQHHRRRRQRGGRRADGTGREGQSRQHGRRGQPGISRERTFFDVGHIGLIRPTHDLQSIQLDIADDPAVDPLGQLRETWDGD